MSTAPRKTAAKTVKPAAKAPKPKAKRTPSTRVKDPVLKSDLYTANVEPAVRDHVVLTSEGKQRAARLRELLEPHNEAMIQVMVDIAMNKDYESTKNLPLDKQRPSIHPSIRLEAADRILLKLHGKPKETHAHEFDNEAGSGDEVLGLLNNILTAVGAPLLELPDPNAVIAPPAPDAE